MKKECDCYYTKFCKSTTLESDVVCKDSGKIVFSKIPNDVTPDQLNYINELYMISFGIGFTPEVEEGMDLINSIRAHRKYFDVDKEKLNNLHKVFNYQKNKGKHFL